MKSTHEPFDEELRERLQQYTEEPDKDLWQGISPHIVSVNPEPGWVLRTQRVSTLIVMMALMMALIQPRMQKMVEDKSLANKEQQGQTENSIGEEENSSPNLAVKEDIMNGHNENGERLDQKTKVLNSSGSISRFKKDIVLKEKSKNPPSRLRNEDASLLLGTMSKASVTVLEKRISEEGSWVESQLLAGEKSDVNILPDTSKITSKKANESDTLKKGEVKKGSNKKKSLKHRKYDIYFTAMPTFGYQRVESNQADNLIIQSIDRVSTFSTKRLGIRVELGIEYPLTKRVNVFGGLLYYQRKQTIGYTEKHLDSTIVTPGPGGEVIIEPMFSYLDKSIEYELENVGIQVGFNYKLSKNKVPAYSSKNVLSSKTIPVPKKRFLHMVGTGLEFHKSLNKTNEFNKVNGFSNPSAYVFFNMYYRLQYPSEGKLRAIFQPTLNYSFYINENLNAPFYVKPYGLGLNFGCTYNF